ncbi:hypothetical protein KUCAC02_011592 [Chaenocephalus aceratus]|uniref:Uncharacterized protein n=1 Tax=Chaenocephalus aceratus TaxID=36190 RepID=A0ACB9WY19_CHAAC|nr:hypothetical protein KUCAC02_011592 [Chaenocephalus aceratus]
MTLTSKAPCFKSKFITAELALLFSQSDSEEEFEGFSEDEEEQERGTFNKRLKNKMVDSEEDSEVDTGFYSDDDEARPPKRNSLLVALRFPVKRRSIPKMEPQEKSVNKPSLQKRNQNIQENKAMLAKLFADLSTMADLTPPTTPHKKKHAPEKATPRKRKFETEMGSERRNPSRKARPRENFAVEEKSEPLTSRSPRTIDPRRLMEVDEEHVGEKKKRRRSQSSRKSQYDVRSVEEITKEDLDNIAYRSKDKIWDKENNRYGEDVCDVLLDPAWSCPICRDMCNCSLCRKKDGRCATGILVGLARYNGHDNVHKYLESIQRDLK